MGGGRREVHYDTDVGNVHELDLSDFLQIFGSGLALARPISRNASQSTFCLVFSFSRFPPFHVIQLTTLFPFFLTLTTLESPLVAVPIRYSTSYQLLNHGPTSLLRPKSVTGGQQSPPIRRRRRSLPPPPPSPRCIRPRPPAFRLSGTRYISRPNPSNTPLHHVAPHRLHPVRNL